MSRSVLRYDRDGVLALQRRTAESLAALETLASGDPAAQEAMRAVRLARANLDGHWLPLLDRIAASDAMITWSVAQLGSTLTGVSALLQRWSEWAEQTAALTGEALGRKLAEQGRRVIADGDTEDIEDLRVALAANQADAVAMETFFAELGAAMTAQLLMRLGTIVGDDESEAALALAATVRTTLADTSARLDAEFAPDLVDAFVDRLDDDDVSPAAALAYLGHDTTYATAFLAGLARRIVEHELAFADGDPTAGFLLWPLAPGFAPPSTLYREFVDDNGDVSDEFFRAGDPLYALLELLAADSVAARELLTNDTVAEYLFAHRDFQLDGMRSLAAAAQAAAAGPDVVADADPELLIDAATVASAFVNHVATRGDDVLWHLYANREVSASAAAILGQHMPAVHFTVLHDVEVDQPRGDTIPMVDAAHGPDHQPVGALLDAAALDVISALAVDTEYGVAMIRSALDLHQVNQAAAAAALLADGVEEPGDFLHEAVADAARLEAHFIEHVGHRAEEHGRSKDVVISFWIDLATFSIGEAIGSQYLGVAVLGAALEPAADAAEELLADHEARAEREATENAEAAADQLAYVWYRQLYRAGVVTPDLPAAAVDDGDLVSWEEFRKLPDRDRAIVRSRMEETTGAHGVNLDGGSLRDVIKVQQLESYQELE